MEYVILWDFSNGEGLSTWGEYGFSTVKNAESYGKEKQRDEKDIYYGISFHIIQVIKGPIDYKPL
jgi:hypothetical protein